MSTTTPKEYVGEVRGHYEELPYPFRDPEKEGQLFFAGDGFNATALNHQAWGGKRDLTRGARILIAGDGTGDASVNWAETCIDGDSEIVAIDISSRSIETAKARLAKRQLSGRVQHHHMSILDLPSSGLGQFDVIECSGVLHHLADPNAGLAALAAMLKDDGIMSIMVYAQYGRIAVYMVQELFQRMMKPEMSRSEKLALARAFLNNTPSTHWLTVKNEAFIADIQCPDGSGIYDLLLHTQDRAYTVPQLYEWVEGAGLKLNMLFTDFTNESVYTPEHYNNDPLVLDAVRDKTPREREAIAELMHGSIGKHNFYATKQQKQPAQFADDMVIAYGLMQSMFPQHIAAIAQGLHDIPIGNRISCAPRPFDAAPPMILTKRPSTSLLLQLIDGTRTIGDITSEAARLGKFSRNDVRKDLQLLYNEMRDRLLVFLRHESVPPYKTGPQMQERIRKLGLIS